MSWFKSKEEKLESKIAKTARKLRRAKAEEVVIADIINIIEGKISDYYIVESIKWRVEKELLQYDLDALVDEKEALEFGKLLGSVK